ncbi:MAG TPA: hypothetical protein VEH06_04875 [Candidatus Bathyarchaeia archaeon]|nr:hypothetical protein [Candidatus Bathyarchaeia archaeon]
MIPTNTSENQVIIVALFVILVGGAADPATILRSMMLGVNFTVTKQLG